MFNITPPLFWLFLYLLVINIFTFATFGADKLYALSNTWRVRERTILLLAFLGGSVGALLGRYLFRHKIRKHSFSVGLLFIFLMQMMIVWYVIEKTAMLNIF
ncbi:MAG TPA: DUF1294 domain-containing protein [Patescibacteria group bacterium]|nr:DUF1294 domain-containing protein [Patescibacteria group bacterium]